MTDQRDDWLAERFEQHRPRLTSVAYRLLGAASEADDAVQETWLRLSRSDADAVDDLGAWLTTVVSRVCLNVLQQRRSRPETPLGSDQPEPIADAPDPEDEAIVADSVGAALLIVLDTLAPAERVAFVLHDMFGVSFAEIAPIVGRSEGAARQLASRARRRVRLDDHEEGPASSRVRHNQVVASFLAAAREGDLDTVLALLDPDAVMRADQAAADLGATPDLRGAQAIAGTLSGWGRGMSAATIDRGAGAAWAPGGRVRVVFRFTISGDTITAIDLIGDPARQRSLEFELAQ